MKSRSARIEKLRKAILESVPAVGAERGRLVTEAYREFERFPILIKRAKTLRKILSEMTIYINEGDLLAGNQAHGLRCPPVYPENFTGWMSDESEMNAMETRTVNPLRIPSAVRPELKTMAEFWKGKTLMERCYAVFPEDVLRARKNLLFSVSLEKNAMGHCVLDYGLLLKKGYAGIKADIRGERDSLDETDPETLGKREFLEAADMACGAIIDFSLRYADLAARLAAAESDPARKRELSDMSEMCRWVPANPARSFHEAVQSVYFAHTVNMIETNAYSMSYGRFDQYIYPFLKRDLEKGIITERWAQEILNCFWCKTNEVMHVDDSEMIYFHGGHPFGQHLTVGGLTREGKDATNDLSYMCLDAHENVALYQPDFSVRFHKDSPSPFRKRAAEVIRLGLGLPQIFNDEVIIESLRNDGLPLEEAMDYTPTGCVEYSTPRCWVRAPGGWLNVPKVLETVLNRGNCALTGTRIGLPTKDPGEMESFDEFYAAFKEQFRHAVRKHVVWSNLIDLVHANTMPQLTVSVLTGDCIEKGRDAVQGGARYNFTSPLLVGLATAADSLAVIRKLVYEDKILSMAELRAALAANFEGYEVLRARLSNFPLRYGNDIDYVDDIARDISVLFCDEFSKYRNTRGGKFRAGFWSVTVNFNLGSNTAATPDGRLAREPLSDSIAPNNGKDVNGLTASLRSAAKLDHKRASTGTVLNRHVSPKEMEGEDKLKKFDDLVRGYFELGARTSASTS